MLNCCQASELNLAEARVRGLRGSSASRTRLYPEYLPRILAQRARGETWEQVGKRWGVKGSAVAEFVAREGRK